MAAVIYEQREVAADPRGAFFMPAWFFFVCCFFHCLFLRVTSEYIITIAIHHDKSSTRERARCYFGSARVLIDARGEVPDSRPTPLSRQEEEEEEEERMSSLSLSLFLSLSLSLSFSLSLSLSPSLPSLSLSLSLFLSLRFPLFLRCFPALEHFCFF